MNGISKVNKTMLVNYYKAINFTDDFSKDEIEAEFRRRYSDEIAVAATAFRLKYQTPIEASDDLNWDWTMADYLAVLDWHDEVHKK